MAEEHTAPETDEAATEQAAEQPEQDYKALYEQVKAESRKWESRSKANAKELEALKKQPAKDRTVEDRLAALEAENESLKASAARSSLVESVAKATGLDKPIVSALNGADEDALTEQARAIAAQLKPEEGGCGALARKHHTHSLCLVYQQNKMQLTGIDFQNIRSRCEVSQFRRPAIGAL